MKNESTESDRQFPADLLVILSLVFGVPLIGVFAGLALVGPIPFWLSLAGASVGVVLLFLAKLPLYQEKKFFTFGTKSLDAKHRKIYLIAYRFIGISIIALLLAIALTRT
jgi:hypothetical protein